MSMGGAPTPSTVAADAQAKTAEYYWERYKEAFVPIENDLIEYARDPAARMQEASEKARGDFETISGKAGEQTLRGASRYGGMTNVQRASMTSRNTLQNALGGVNVTNQTKRQVGDEILGLNQALVAQGRGIAAEGSAGQATAASLEAQRNQTNATNAAAARNATMGLAGTAVGVVVF